MKLKRCRNQQIAGCATCAFLDSVSQYDGPGFVAKKYSYCRKLTRIIWIKMIDGHTTCSHEELPQVGFDDCCPLPAGDPVDEIMKDLYG